MKTNSPQTPNPSNTHLDEIAMLLVQAIMRAKSRDNNFNNDGSLSQSASKENNRTPQFDILLDDI